MRTDGQINRQTDRQTKRPTDMTNLIATFRNFTNAPENDRIFVAQAFGTIKKQHSCMDIYRNVNYKLNFFSMFRFI